MERLGNEHFFDPAAPMRVTRGCQFGIGLGICLDLYANLGQGAFKRGFRHVYHSMQWRGNEDCNRPLYGLLPVKR